MRKTITIRDDGTSIYSATFCERTGVPALWDDKRWACQVHPGDSCLATFTNRSMLAEYTPEPPRWEPTKAEVAKAKREAKKYAVHHSFTVHVQQELTLDEYEAVFDRLEKAVGKVRHFSQGGPIPEVGA